MSLILVVRTPSTLFFQYRCYFAFQISFIILQKKYIEKLAFSKFTEIFVVVIFASFKRQTIHTNPWS